MAQTLEQIIETHLKVIDAATGPLAKIAAQAEKTAGGLERAGKAAAHGGQAGAGAFGTLFDTLKGMAGISGVVGVALGLHAAIESTEKYMNNLKQVHEITGATVSQTDFLLSSARRAGVGYDTMVNAMTRLSKKGAMLATSQAAMSQQVPGMGKRFAALGVDLKKGPVASMEAMSKAVKTGKIGVGELMGQFGIPAKEAADMRDFLNELDPKKLAAAKKGGGGFMDEGTMKAFKAIEQAQHRIADTWNRIKITVITKLYPIVANMAEEFAGKLERFLPKLEDAMQYVADNMDRIVAAAKIFVSVMTAKKVVSMMASAAGPEGIVGKLAKMGGAGDAVAGAAKTAEAGGFLSQLKLINVSFGAALPVIIALAAAAAVAYLGFKAFEKNLRGVADRIQWHIDMIVARFQLIWESLGALGHAIAGMFGEGGSLGDLLGYISALSFDYLLMAFDTLVHVLQTVASMTGELANMFQWLWKDVLHDLWIEYVQDPFLASMKAIGKGVGWVVDFFVKQYNRIAGWLGREQMAGGPKFDMGWLEEPIKLVKKHWNLTNELTKQKVRDDRDTERRKKKKEPEDEKPAKTEMNFPNARFDITQNFAEGFDPDRIAVAFANDIASLGEMRSSSAMVLAPTGVR
jgi:hypothetical protein